MELATKITAVSTRGEWFSFDTEAGVRVDTKDVEIANSAQALLNQPVVIDYSERPSRNINSHTGQPFINRYLNRVEAASNGNTPTYAETNTTGPSITTSGSTGTLPVPDERGARMGRNNIAASAVDALLKMTDGKPETIQKILDGLAHWSETGEPIFFVSQLADAEHGIPF